MKSKQNMRQLSIIGTLIFCLGLIVFGVAFGLGGWNISKLSSSLPLESQSYDYASNDQTVVVQDSNVRLHLGVSPDNRIRLSCMENEKEWYAITEEQGELRIEKAQKRSWMDYFFVFELQSRNLTLLLPKGYKGTVQLTTSNNTIDVQDLTLQQASFVSSNGAIAIENVSVTQELKLDTSNASIKLTTLSAAKLTAKSSNGSIQVENTTVTGDTRMDTSNNSIILDNFTPGADTQLTSSNGSVKGTLVGNIGDFTIESSTSNGESSLPKHSVGGEKLLTVKTSNANIAMEFVK